MVTDANQTDCGDHFAIHAHIKSLHCLPETNITVSINYLTNRQQK